MSVQVSYKKQVTLGIIGITILLLAIEIIANIWWIGQVNCEFEHNEVFQDFDEIEKRQICLDFYDIKTSGNELIPNQSTDSITVNSLGFRGTEFSEIKPDDTYRIFMVGGSTMFGAGATSDVTTIPGILQKIFDSNNSLQNIEVINAGFSGGNSESELKLIKQKLVTLSPDLIIVYDGWNDLRANNTPMDVKENWKGICKLGEIHNFDTIITLQPIAGFGNKKLTQQEMTYAQIGDDYTNNPLIESLSIYQDYAKNLSDIKSCTKTFDLRDVFDNETRPIYWDQGHVSDRGNSIVAESLFNTVFPIVSENYALSIFETKKYIQKTTTSLYNDREIVVSVELLPTNESKNKQIKISAYDNTYNEVVLNVTYFLTISKNNENLLREYFFAKDGILILDVFSEDSNQVQILGEKQYDHNAYVMSEIAPLQVKGPIFATDGTYMFDTELRTIDSVDNWVFNLSGFHSEINIEKDSIEQETFTENELSFEAVDFLRKIFSNYKTPILFNHIIDDFGK